MQKKIMFACIILSLSPGLIHADGGGEEPLTRTEVGVIKKKIQAVIAAIGNPPEGYSKSSEDFDIPTKVYTTSGGFEPVSSSARFVFGGGAEALAAEYQKKLMEAQAKGDRAAMGRIAAEMQSKMMAASANQPVQVNVEMNHNYNVEIDPDGVLLENPGVLAMVLNEGEGRADVEIYFDPVNLTNTQDKSSVDIPAGAVKNKTSTVNIKIELSGPAEIVREWAKRIQAKAVLAQIN